jgi:hypothetical protein
MSNKIYIKQPQYLPWIGLFRNIIESDILVILDDVQYAKNGWYNRNKIRTFSSWMWLTLPVKSRLGEKINEVKIDNSQRWQEKHSKAIYINYQKSEYFEQYWDKIKNIYDKKYEFLFDINLDFIKLFLDIFGINKKIIFSSELNIQYTGSDRLFEICNLLEADIYLSGEMGKKYLKENDFKRKGINIEYQNFQHPEYKQPYKLFIPNMSFIDLLFNEGDNALKIIKDAKNV